MKSGIGNRMASRLRVLHVTECIHGGVETYLKSVIPAQQKKYATVKLITNAMVHWLDQDNQRIFGDGRRSIKNLWQLISALNQELSSNDYDIVHLHSSFAGIVGRLVLLFRSKLKVIYCSHGWAYDIPTSRFKSLYRGIESVLSELSHGVVCISQHEYNIAVGSKDKRYLVPNGIVDNFEQLTPLPTVKNLLFVGRLDEQKGVDLLLRAYQNHPFSFDLTIVGNAVHGNTDYADVQHPSIHFKGWLSGDDLINEYRRASAVIVPSRWEGFGLVAVESMSASRPIITSGVGGLYDLTVESNGILFRGYDELVQALERFEELDIDEMESLSVAAREAYLAKYTDTILNNNLVSVYEAVMA
jgi:glycosyltransferase involved in cell wall biosynthesis